MTNSIEERLDAIESQLRENFHKVEKFFEKFSCGTENDTKLNLMQLRVAAYRKIKKAVEQIDRLLDIIDTEYVTDINEIVQDKVVRINRQQEENHNRDFREIAEYLRELRWLLISPPENYQENEHAAEKTPKKIP